MATNPFLNAAFLTGPTAVGKTAVSVELARKLNAEIIALDSMTLYRGMNIGTAKPTLEEREGIDHHLIDILDPWESFTVADYRARATKVVEDILERGRRPLFVGGTALYLKALLRGLFDGPAADQTIRGRLEEEAEAVGDIAIHQRLAVVDPSTANRLHPNDRRRVIRALEVYELTGIPLSAHQVEHGEIAPIRVIALERARPELHERINQRVAQMFDAGLIEEVERLAKNPQGFHPTPAQGVGYRECLDLISGRITRVEAIEHTATRTRQFAKRQATWFRGLAEVESLWVDSDDGVPTIVARILKRLKRT